MQRAELLPLRVAWVGVALLSLGCSAHSGTVDSSEGDSELGDSQEPLGTAESPDVVGPPDRDAEPSAELEPLPEPGDRTQPDSPAAEDDSPGSIDPCESVQRLSVDPEMDGELEEGLVLNEVLPQGWTSFQELPAGNAVSYALGWRSNGLYLFAHVSDPERSPAPPYARIWAGDGFEFFLDHDAVIQWDGQYDPRGTRALTIGAPASDELDGRRAALFRNAEFLSQATDVNWISHPTEFGYVIEAFLDANALGLADWTLQAGDALAFNLAHNVSYPEEITGPNGNRLGQYVMRLAGPERGGYPQVDARSFCSTRLAP